jgi:hypothetical protein
MATTRKLNGVTNEKLWSAMLAAMPVVIKNGANHPPKGSAQLAREYAQAWVQEWRRAVSRGDLT